MFLSVMLALSILVAICVAVVVWIKRKNMNGYYFFVILSIAVIFLVSMDVFNLYRLQARRSMASQYIKEGMTADEVANIIDNHKKQLNISHWNNSEKFIAVGLKGPFSLSALLKHGESLWILTATKDPLTDRLTSPLNGE